MNIAEIRQRIYDQMDFNPDIQQYRDSIVRRINDHYHRINDSAHWLFLQKETRLQLRQNVTGSDTVYFQVSSANTRAVTSASSGFNFSLEMEGQTLIDEDGVEFRSVRVYDRSTMYIEPLVLGDIDSITDPSIGWTGDTATNITSFTIRFDRFALPKNCIEVLGYVDREADRGRLVQIDRRREEFAYLDRDTEGDAFVIVDDESIFDEPPLEAGPDGLFSVATSNVTQTSNDLLPNVEYEYFYTIYREGRESPRSTVISVTTVPGTKDKESVNVLSNMENTGWNLTDPISYLASGKQKIIYRRDKTNDGPWLMVGVVASTVTTFTDNELYPSTAFQHLKYSDFRFNDHDAIRRYDDPGPRQYIRTWHSPGSDKKLHLRYHYRPKNLVADADAPVWPRQYHHLLVYLTLEDLFLQMQDTTQAGIFRGRAEQLLMQMRRRYLSRDETRKRFSRFDKPRRFRAVGAVGTGFYGADGP